MPNKPPVTFYTPAAWDRGTAAIIARPAAAGEVLASPLWARETQSPQAPSAAAGKMLFRSRTLGGGG